MGVGSPAAAAGLAACRRRLWTCRGRFQGLGWILTVGNGLLEGSNILLLCSRRVSRDAAAAIPLAVTPQIQMFAIRKRQCDRARRAGLNLFPFEDPVAFNQ